MDFSFYFDLPLWIRTVLQGIAVIAVIFPISAACSMAERKVAAWIQGRPGPNRAIVPWVAPIPFLGRFLQRLGVFQLMADGGKFVFKEDVIPGHVNKFYYYIVAAAGPDPRAHDRRRRAFRRLLGSPRGGPPSPDIRRSQRRPARRVRDFVARVFGHHRRLGFEFEVPVPRQRARVGPAHFL